jgi:hypothetical protein
MVKIGIIGELSVGKSTIINIIKSKYLSSNNFKIIVINNDFCKESIDKTIQTNNKIDTGINYIFDFKLNINFNSLNNNNNYDIFFDYLQTLDYVIYISNSSNTMTLQTENHFFDNLINKTSELINSGHFIQIIIVFNKFDIINNISDIDNKYYLKQNIYNKIEIIKDSYNKVLNNNLIKIENIFKTFIISSQKILTKHIMENNNLISNIPSNIINSILINFYNTTNSKLILSDQEFHFINYINDILDFKNFINNIQTFIIDSIHDNYDFLVFTDGYNSYKEYHIYSQIRKLFDSYQENYIKNLNLTTLCNFKRIESYFTLFPNNTLDKHNLYKTLFSNYCFDFEYESNDDEEIDYYKNDDKILFEMFLKEKISNFILLKTKNNYNWLPFLLTSNISYVFEHLDSIKNTHNDLNQISTIIDMNIIYNCSNVNYYINHNKYLNYALCNFINNFDNYKEFLTKNIFSYIDNYSRKPNNHNDSHIIKTYKPIIPKYEIKKENVDLNYYPLSLIEFFNDQNDTYIFWMGVGFILGILLTIIFFDC